MCSAWDFGWVATGYKYTQNSGVGYFWEEITWNTVARGGAFGWDTALQAGRSRVRWCHCDFFYVCTVHF